MKEIKNLLIVNVESDGLSRFDNILQAGWAIYDVEIQNLKAMGCTNFKSEENKAYEHNRLDIKHTNGCPKDLAKFFEYPIKNYKYDYVVAHNANFVKMYFDYWKIRAKKPWICTHSDINWSFIRTRNLVLIADYLNINSGNLHGSGASNCALIIGCFSRINNLQELLQDAVTPKKTYYADIETNDFGLAKKAGFEYDADLKVWKKKVREEDINSFEFKLREATRG